jgi:hypothetical protein
MRNKFEDEVFGNMNRLMSLTNDEDDRGLALSMAAFSENCLGRLLIAYMCDEKASFDLVEGFNAPLGTFSSRIKAGAALGLLSKNQQADLDLARKVRNEFAHSWEDCSFEKQNIKDWVLQMSDSRIHDRHPITTRRKFHYTMSCTLVELEYLLSTLGNGKRRIPIVAHHLSTKPPK